MATTRLPVVMHLLVDHLIGNRSRPNDQQILLSGLEVDTVVVPVTSTGMNAETTRTAVRGVQVGK